MTQFSEALSQNSYPGRGILLGKSEDGQSAVIAYFIMGRSTAATASLSRRATRSRPAPLTRAS